MTDLYKRLVALEIDDGGRGESIYAEAAAEIARLDDKLILAVKQIDAVHADNERLRAALDDCIHGRRDWMEKAKRALEGK